MCPFFSKALGVCEIYPVRPVDCRLFPLDLALRDGRCWWVVYNLPGCELATMIGEDDVIAAERLVVPFLGHDVARYAATRVTPMYQKIMRFIRPLGQ